MKECITSVEELENSEGAVEQLSPDLRALRIMVDTRDDIQGLRRALEGRLKKKADGSDQRGANTTVYLEEDKAAILDLLLDLKKFESKCDAAVSRKMESCFPLEKKFLFDPIPGLGDMGGARLLSRLNIHIADTPSKLWQYCGYNPGLVKGKKRCKAGEWEPSMGPIVRKIFKGRGKARKMTHVIYETEQMIRGDDYTKGFVLPFCKPMRVAMYNIESCLMKAGVRWRHASVEEYERTPEAYRKTADRRKQGGKKDQEMIIDSMNEWARVYYDRRHKRNHDTRMTTDRRGNGKVVRCMWKDCCDQHKHADAMRYVGKMFLVRLYQEWRKLEGLPVRPPYQEEKLGHVHNRAA